MIRKSTRYDAAKFVWFVLVVGVVVAVYSGEAEPYVSPSQLPGSPPVALGGAVAVGLVGIGVITVQQTRAWRAAGRRAGLAPAGRGLFGKPDLTGTVDGRPVRARTVKRKTGNGGESGSSKSTYTVVEADLRREAEEGLIVTPATGARTQSTTAGFAIDTEHVDVTDDELAAVGGPEAVARAVISGPSREAILALDGLDFLYVGDAAGALSGSMPDVSDSRLGPYLVGKATDRVPGDAGTASVETKGLVLDGDRLRRQAAAVAAVADAFEESTAGT